MNDLETARQKSAKLLDSAQKAFNQGDVVEALRVLDGSRYLDGLVRRLSKEWRGSLPTFEIEDCIAEAVDSVCAAASGGTEIRSLGAWLWKCSMNKANDKWRVDYSRRRDIETATADCRTEPSETDEERRAREGLEDARRDAGIRVARKLLPEFGEGQLRDVMELVIAAVEDELPDLPAAFIAESLGIQENAARALLSRGLRRLRKLTNEMDAEFPEDLPETDTDY